MAINPDEQIFTFVAVRADGTMPVLDIAPCADEAEAIARATAWLSTHSTCERVLIWSEREFVGEASLADGGLEQSRESARRADRLSPAD